MFPRSCALLGGAGLTMALAACAGAGGGGETAASMAEMEPVTLSFHYLSTEQSHQGQGLTAMAQYVDENSDGKIKIEGHPAGSLLKPGEELEGVGSGLADMGLVIPSLEAQELPITAWANQFNPLSAESMPHSLLQLAAAYQDVQAHSDAIQEEWKSHGVLPLAANVGEIGYNLQCTEPVSTPDQAKGVTARVGSEPWISEVKAMGFEPVSLAITEAYEALQRKAVDCVVGSAPTQKDFSFWEVAPYFVPVSTSTNGTALAINQGKWDELPEDAQDLLQEAAYVYLEGSLKTALENYKVYAEQAPTEHNVEFLDPSKLQEPLDAHQEAAIEELVANPPAGIDDPQSFLEDYKKAMENALTLAEDAVGSPVSDASSAADIIDGYRGGAGAVDVKTFIDGLRQAAESN